MNIALTGGTGFLGRYLARQLVSEGHQVRCWYREKSDRSGFDDIEQSLQWCKGELGDSAAVDSLIEGIDAVVHAGVQWAGPRTRRGGGTHGGAEVFMETNLLGSLQLFRKAREANIARFVFVSTCAVHEVILEDRPLDEAHPLWPMTHYGAHKAALEKFVHSYGFGEGWPICSLRPTGIYGLAHPPSASRWFDLVGQVMRGEPIASPKGGKEVHAADVAKAVSLLLQAPEEKIVGQAFNCYDRYISEQHVATLARELSGSSSTIEDLNKGPKHQIENNKLRALGMEFGGQPLLRATIEALIQTR